MKAIIWGINGQDGYYLRRLLQDHHIHVIGISRSETYGNRMDLKGDVSDFGFVEQLIKTEKPDYIFHLAASSTTSHEALLINNEAISNGTIYLLESVKRHSPASKVFITGSGVQFKNTGHPISEKDEFEANSAYSVARIHSAYAARYFRSLGIQTYVGYLFHHESPLRKEHHISKLTSDAIKRIGSGDAKKIQLGDITVKKEWGFAGDIVEGIFTLVNQNEYFEATIGTGQVYSIEEWLATCFSLIDKNYKDFIEVKSDHFKAEYKLLLSNPETMNKIGWYPRTSFSDLANMMMAM